MAVESVLPSPEHDRLQELGRVLYGPWWVLPVATAIGMTTPPLWRIQAGQKPVPASLWARLLPVAEARVRALSDLVRDKRWTCADVDRPAFLAVVGEALFATRWKQPMAECLMEMDPRLFASEARNVAAETRGLDRAAPDRKLGRMASGTQAMPEEVWMAVRQLLTQRRDRLRAMLPELRDATPS